MNNDKEAIYDARSLGRPKMLALGFQHMFAMFGATVLVPAITGLSVSATLLFAGLGTLLFHFVTKRKVPAFLGSSFAFLGGYAAVVSMGAEAGLSQAQALPYACVGVFFAGLLYFVLSALIKSFGLQRVIRFFPPVVTGPIVIAIGLVLSGTAISSCTTNWWIALVAIITIIICNIWGKGMVKIVPILLGVVVSYVFAACIGKVDFSAVKDAAWIGLPVMWENTALSVFENPDWGLFTAAIIAVMPIALATMVEHIGDMFAISSTVGKNYIEDPGLHRTLVGDGLATMLASVFGAPANTTYGENTGVLNLTKVFDPRVIRIAAVFAILFSFSPKFAAVISSMPAATVGGVSLILYGMIASVGVRNLVESNVDFKISRNVIVAALILVLAIGIKYGAGDSINLGFTSLSGLAVAAIVGIVLNAVLPEK
ncbi:MAG: uracil-xanthine permease family protein [Bacteroidales bacterium]|nr:uracil-xanthine permease family protein [Bacteroidales bacterium]